MKTTFCDCAEDGFCPRYQCEMRGRFRQICQGVNCDLGTAAAFREQWARESGMTKPSADPPIPLLLKTDQAPGDAVTMTASIYSLHRAHPGRYLTAVESPYPEVFAYNSDVVPAESIPSALPLQMHYPAIHQSNQRGIHFMQGWCEFLGFALGINVPLLTNRPHLYFADPAPPVEDYWVVCSGGKNDLTNKLWGFWNYQNVVSDLHGQIRFVQVGDSLANHPPLALAECRVGETTLRELFDLVRRARGVLCGVSLLMHIAAALQKPAVVIAGGREPVQWNSYPHQYYMHTVGLLGCTDPRGNSGGACWRSRIVPLGDHPTLDQDTCLRPVNGTPTRLTACAIPQCMSLIRPRYVVETIMQAARAAELNSLGR